MYVVIVANAPSLSLDSCRSLITNADVVIAADGGANALLEAHFRPLLVIGDLDSLDDARLAALAANGVELRRFPREKDETDLELALLHAAAIGAEQIDVLGALGGRWDHTFANVAMLAMPELRGRQVRLIDERQRLFLVRDQATLEGSPGDTLSLLPLTPTVHGVTTRGLFYALDNATLHFERARGVSNILIDPPGFVSLREGLLLVVQHDDRGALQWNVGR
ncbi:MAG: thiamine diphosphokinase [Roseiflexus sp.]